MGRIRFAKEETKMTVVDLADSALGVAQELRDELQEWLDGIPENLQQGQKADELREAIDAIESFAEESLPDLPESAAEAMGSYRAITARKMSRRLRRDDALLMLDAAAQALQAFLDEEENGLDESGEAEVQEAISELERWRDEFDGVEFPGMF